MHNSREETTTFHIKQLCFGSHANLNSVYANISIVLLYLRNSEHDGLFCSAMCFTNFCHR